MTSVNCRCTGTHQTILKPSFCGTGLFSTEASLAYSWRSLPFCALGKIPPSCSSKTEKKSAFSGFEKFCTVWALNDTDSFNAAGTFIWSLLYQGFLLLWDILLNSYVRVRKFNDEPESHPFALRILGAFSRPKPLWDHQIPLNWSKRPE